MSQLLGTQVAQLVRGVGLTGDAAMIAVAIAKGESGWRTDAQGDTTIQTSKWGPSVGLWQVRSLKAEYGTGGTRDASRLTDPQFNAASMLTISNGGRNWQPWTVFTSGAYRSHLEEARQALATLGGAGVVPDQVEIGPTGPPPTGSLIIGGRLIQPSKIRITGSTVLADVTVTSAVLDRNIDDADRLILTVSDPRRELLRSPTFEEEAYTDIDGVNFALTGHAKRRGELTLTFTDAAAVDLNRPLDGPGPVQAATATRGDWMRRLVGLVPWVEADIEPGLTGVEPLAMQPGETPWQALGRAAAQVQWRRCAVANRVLLGSDGWLAGRTAPVEVREFHDGVDEIDFDSDFGVPADTATIRCSAGLWAAPPTTAVILADMGFADGEWLVSRFRRPDTTDGRAEVHLTRARPGLNEPSPPAEATSTPIATGSVIDGPPAASPPELPAALDADDPVQLGAVSSRGYQWPLRGRVSSGFRTEARPNHMGIDIAVPVGTTIWAARGGQVVSVGLVGGYGLLVIVRHDDESGRRHETYYAHCNSAQVRPGQWVDRGRPIAISGGAPGTPNAGNSRGPHLHFEVRINGLAQNPIAFLP